MLYDLFWTAAGYLSGSVMYSYLLPQKIKGIDVCERSADGNPGAANAFSQAGIPIGLLCVAADVLKGFLPVRLFLRAGGVLHPLFALVLAAPVLGHASSRFFGNKKRGGKAIAVSFGVTLGVLPETRPFVILAASYLLFSLVIRIYPNAVRSIVTFTVFGSLCALCLSDGRMKAGFAIIAAVVVIKHLEGCGKEKAEICFFKKRGKKSDE